MCPGNICSNPLSMPVNLVSTASKFFQCNDTNTPPSSKEMGLKDQGINQYAEMMFELGQQSDGLFETMSLIYYHYTDPAQNPKSLPGGTEHGGNFRYGVGVAAALDGAGMGELAADYIIYGGSAFQDALQNYTEAAQDAPFYNELDWYYQIGILNNAVGKAILINENSTDQQSIREGIAFFREVYKIDSNRGNVKNSCSQKPKDPTPTQTVSGVSRPGYFFMPTISGGSIQRSIMYGSICDPSDDCFRDLPDDKDQK